MRTNLAVLALLLIAVPCLAQTSYNLPHVMLGGDAALFRISLDDFTQIYQHRIGPSFSGFLGIRAFSGYYLTGKFGQFYQDGKKSSHTAEGISTSLASWREKWYNIGVRNHPPITRNLHSFFGFGIVFFHVDESDSVSIFKNKTLKHDSGLGNGFYLELGMDYFLRRSLAAYFLAEVSSGGERGQTGFEAFSIGGFRLGLGVIWWPF
jgi:hypothetical protein